MNDRQRRIAVWVVIGVMTIPAIISVIGAIRGSMIPFY